MINLNRLDEALLESDPTNYELRADISFKAGKFEQALEYIDKEAAQHHTGKHVEERANILIKLKRFKEAYDVIESENPDKLDFENRWDLPSLLFLRAQAHLGLDDRDHAIEDLRKAIPMFYRQAEIKSRDSAQKLIDTIIAAPSKK